ncbi:hypothetical protein EVB41_022 [Rhizobium phage RHph_TM3_14A]|nr:hypothetical protein EVB41_022 [Rhizobium phage RHph_TM3_14A]
MGRMHRPFGLPKPGRVNGKKKLQAIGMLLDAVWDREACMFVKREDGVHGGVQTNFTRYFNRKGEEITLREAKTRMKMADKKKEKEVLSWGASSVAWSKRLGKRYNEQAIHNITSEGNHEQTSLRNSGNDTIRVARHPTVCARR